MPAGTGTGTSTTCGSGVEAGGAGGTVSSAIPSTTDFTRILPALTNGRTASSFDAANGGDGKAARRLTSFRGSLGRLLNPAGSITSALPSNEAYFVFAARNCC